MSAQGNFAQVCCAPRFAQSDPDGTQIEAAQSGATWGPLTTASHQVGPKGRQHGNIASAKRANYHSRALCGTLARANLAPAPRFVAPTAKLPRLGTFSAGSGCYLGARLLRGRMRRQDPVALLLA